MYKMALLLCSFLLVGCATQPISADHQSESTKKKPEQISLLTKKPRQAFQIVGMETVSKFNFGGHIRQKAMINDAMKKMAAAMGGDAIMDITHDTKTVSATVIKFKEIV